MSESVTRPEATPGKKIKSSEEFELCYLRHQYLRKAKSNPSPEEMEPYYNCVKSISKRTYFYNQKLFGTVGLESEDLINIAKVHLVSYLGLFSIELKDHKYEKFIIKFAKKNYAEPSAFDILQKNKADFTSFLKQRMEDLVRISKQKAKNVKGFIADDFHCFSGSSVPLKIQHSFFEQYDKLGYRKVDLAVYRTVKRKAKIKEDIPFQYCEKWYFTVKIGKKVLSLMDLEASEVNPFDNAHNMNPHEIIDLNEQTEYWEKKRLLFDTFSVDNKLKVIRNFISTNKNNPKLKEEIRAARNFLKTLEK